MSDNYFLSGKENNFFLKKYRFNNSKRIDKVHSVKKYFADGGIPVILPIRLLDGRTFFEYKNDFYTLFPFIDGLHLEENSLTKTSIISVITDCGRFKFIIN